MSDKPKSVTGYVQSRWYCWPASTPPIPCLWNEKERCYTDFNGNKFDHPVTLVFPSEQERDMGSGECASND